MRIRLVFPGLVTNIEFIVLCGIIMSYQIRYSSRASLHEPYRIFKSAHEYWSEHNYCMSVKNLREFVCVAAWHVHTSALASRMWRLLVAAAMDKECAH